MELSVQINVSKRKVNCRSERKCYYWYGLIYIMTKAVTNVNDK